jgi:hypothetical protein
MPGYSVEDFWHGEMLGQIGGTAALLFWAAWVGFAWLAS